MTATHADQIIQGYMKRLEGELATLPSERRRELSEQISEHIASARATLAVETDAELLTILDRLGEPDQIASEARSRFSIPNTNPGPLEILALLLLGIGGVVLPLPAVPWILGVGLIWFSKVWSPSEKSRGAYAPLVVVLAALLLALLVGGVAGFQGSIIFVGLIAGILVPVGSAIYLGWRLRGRLPTKAWIAIAIVALAVYLPAAAMFFPARTSGFLGADGPPGSAPLRVGQTGCGAFYGTAAFAYGTPFEARLPVSVGICTDGQRVTKAWGPDCGPHAPTLVMITVQSCMAITEPDGSMLIEVQSTARPLTAPFFNSGRGFGWRITPDGNVMQFG